MISVVAVVVVITMDEFDCSKGDEAVVMGDVEAVLFVIFSVHLLLNDNVSLDFFF